MSLKKRIVLFILFLFFCYLYSQTSALDRYENDAYRERFEKAAHAVASITVDAWERKEGRK